MTRRARKLSTTGVYHVMLRGNERKAILADPEEKRYFLNCLITKKQQAQFSVYAYCLMDNHVHLLIAVQENEISAIIKGIATRYAFFYNNRHTRVGHVFQDRFKSEPVENDRYLMAAIRYIHNNPVAAGIVKQVAEYPWSSYSTYVGTKPTGAEWLDSSFILDILASDRRKAIDEFRRFSMTLGEESFIDIEETQPIRTVDEGTKVLQQYLQRQGIITAIEDVKKNRDLRGQAIAYLRANTGLSQRKIAELLKVDKSVIEAIEAKER